MRSPERRNCSSRVHGGAELCVFASLQDIRQVVHEILAYCCGVALMVVIALIE